MILILLFYQDPSQRKRNGASALIGKQQPLKCVDRLVFESGRQRKLELAKFYDVARVIVLSDDLRPWVTWGIDG